LALHPVVPPAALSAVNPASDAAVEVTSLSTEYAAHPIGLDVRQPRLAWHLQSGARGVVQSA
jgi:alpha-L-rhamnosidase